MPRSVVVEVHHGRCGSTVVGDLLDQHSKIHWDSEIYYLPGWMDTIMSKQRRTFERDGIEHMRERIRASKKEIYSFEFQPHNLVPMGVEMIEYLTLCEESGTSHFIHLSRKNILRKVISSLVAMERKVFHYKIGETPPLTRMKIHTDHIYIKDTGSSLVEYIEQTLRQEKEISEFMRSKGRRGLFMSYEDDVEKNPFVGYRKVCEFLGEEPEKAEIRFSKATAIFRMEDIVENWNDVVAALMGTRHEWMLIG